MITERTGRLIVLLLVAILGVLFFGRETMTPFIFIGAFAVIFICIIGLIMSHVAPDFFLALLVEKEGGGSPLLFSIAMVGVVGNIAVCAWALYVSFGPQSFKEALADIPYFWVPIAVFMVAYLLNEGLKKLRNKKTDAP